MKKILLATLMLGVLAGCSKQEESKAKVVQPTTTQEVKKQLLNDVQASNTHDDITPEEANAFAEQLYQKIVKDQRFLEDAFELQKPDTLRKYTIMDWVSYADTPHQYAPRALAQVGFVYFPKSEVMYPYSVCDTAFQELSLYASAMGMRLREDTADSRQILQQEKGSFEKSVAKCKHRVELSYADALAEFDSE